MSLVILKEQDMEKFDVGTMGSGLHERVVQFHVTSGSDMSWVQSQTSRMQSDLPSYWADGVPVDIDRDRYSAHLAAKAVLDVVLASVAIVALLPLLALVAIAIKLTSKGPVLFVQAREGLDGKIFQVFKFRSMRTDECDISGVKQTASGDPRVTPIGRFIRKTSIDELPQLFNIVRREMSIVGPRPHVKGMQAGDTTYDKLVPYYDYRHQVLPGLTGWAQANGLRGPTTDAIIAKARLDHDVAYVQNLSIWLDLRIIWRTLMNEFIGGSGS